MSLPPSAQTTGISIKVGSREIHQLRCPDCQRLQWHVNSLADCIYCESRFTVLPFKVIATPALLPEHIEEE